VGVITYFTPTYVVPRTAQERSDASANRYVTGTYLVGVITYFTPTYAVPRTAQERSDASANRYVTGTYAVLRTGKSIAKRGE